jgi:hypothetical protein
MKKPLTISMVLFLFLFGLAYAKTEKFENQEKNEIRQPATTTAFRAE